MTDAGPAAGGTGPAGRLCPFAPPIGSPDDFTHQRSCTAGRDASGRAGGERPGRGQPGQGRSWQAAPLTPATAGAAVVVITAITGFILAIAARTVVAAVRGQLFPASPAR